MKPLEHSARWLAARTGWPRRGLAVFLGVLALPAFPPRHWIWCLFLVFPVLLWLLDSVRSRRAAFGLGWWFGVGHFALGFSWVAPAFFVEAEKWGWLVVPALLAGGAFFGVYTGLVLWATSLVAAGPRRLPAFAGAWIVGEWLRGWVLTGSPWKLLATVWMPFESLLQSVPVVGAYGLSGLAALLLSLPALGGWPGERGKKRGLAGATLLLFVLMALWGARRLETETVRFEEGVNLRIVQGGIPQKNKWQPDRLWTNLMRHVRLSELPGLEAITHVIWPETGAPFPLDTYLPARGPLASVIPEAGGLITGMPRFSREGGEPHAYNSLAFLEDIHGPPEIYDKQHLVPFGEYVPFSAFLPLDRITPGHLNFSPGDGPRVRRHLGLPPFVPLICYEILFPGAVVPDGERPSWLLNATNDAWYGHSAGPYQHLAASRLRAVEEGLPVVRAANNGISAVIDPYGRLRLSLPFGRRGILDARLPRPAPLTPFARLGNLIPLFLAAVLLSGALGRRSRFSCRTRPAGRHED